MRNGGAYVKACVQSILTQTVSDLNLIILDSGSTDGTVEWIQAHTDPRIIFHPAPRPLNIEENWGRILTVPKGEWMTLIGHDDLLHPHYLEEMEALIRLHPDASLYAPHFDFIDEAGQVIRQCKPMPETQTACAFTEKILQHAIDAVGLMMRSKDYEAVGGIPLYPNLLFADFVIWIELTKLAYKATSASSTLSYRIHQTNTTHTSRNDKYHAAYDNYIHYLHSLKSEGACFHEVINNNISGVLRSRCLEFTQRLLKTAPKDRTSFRSVQELVEKHNGYARLLIDNNTLDLLKLPQIRLAKLIDATRLGRAIYSLLR